LVLGVLEEVELGLDELEHAGRTAADDEGAIGLGGGGGRELRLDHVGVDKALAVLPVIGRLVEGQPDLEVGELLLHLLEFLAEDDVLVGDVGENEATRSKRKKTQTNTKKSSDENGGEKE